MSYADGKRPDIRVSDAERDTVVSQLGQHFQDGRLDQAEFGERVSAAISAKTASELDVLMTDLPAAPRTAQPVTASPIQRRAWSPPRALAFLPLVFAALVIAGAFSGGWHHGWAGGWPFAPFAFAWLIIGLVAIRARIYGGRRRQWR